MDYYKILEVEPNCSEKELRKAYRVLTLRYHPDKNKECNAIQKFQHINEAFDTLRDPEKRQQYDMKLMSKDKTNSSTSTSSFVKPPPNPHHSINTLLSEMYAFHPHFQLFQPPFVVPLLHCDLYLTLEQSYEGGTFPIELERKGVVYISVPFGIDHHETLLLKGEGTPFGNGQFGDVLVRIVIDNKTEFIRKGLDLVIEKTISFKESLCGFSFVISHLNGRKLCLNNLENRMVVLNGSRKIIPQLGFRKCLTKENNAIVVGNLVVEFKVSFPDKLNLEQIKMIEELF